MTQTGQGTDYRYHALAKEALLLVPCERLLADLDATPTERAHIMEALRHG